MRSTIRRVPCSLRSAATTTAGPRSSRSRRIRAGGASWSSTCPSAPTRGCSTWPRGRARSPARWCGATAAACVGVDQSPQMLEGARERIGRAGLADRIELRLGSAEELDLAEGSFDALTAGYLLRYLDDPLRDRSASCCGWCGPARRSRCSTSPCRRTSPRAASGTSTPASGCRCSAAWSRRAGPRSGATCGRASPPSTRSTRRRRCASCCSRRAAANVNMRRMSLGGGLVAWGVRAVR